MDAPSSFNRYYVTIVKIWERPTVRKFSTLAATLFLIAFFILVALKPTIETIFTLNKKIQDAKDTEMQMTTKIGAINQAINTSEKYKEDILRLNEYLPDTPESEKIISILNTNIQKSSIDKAGYSLSSFPIYGENGQITISLNSSNQYQNILNLMSNLFQSKRLITINSLSISKSKDEKTLDFSINANSYYEKE